MCYIVTAAPVPSYFGDAHTQPASAPLGAAALPLAAGKPGTPSTYRGHTRDLPGTVGPLSHAQLLPVGSSMHRASGQPLPLPKPDATPPEDE